MYFEGIQCIRRRDNWSGSCSWVHVGFHLLLQQSDVNSTQALVLPRHSAVSSETIRRVTVTWQAECFSYSTSCFAFFRLPAFCEQLKKIKKCFPFVSPFLAVSSSGSSRTSASLSCGKERESWIHFRARWHCQLTTSKALNRLFRNVPIAIAPRRAFRECRSFWDFIEIASDTFKRDDWLQIFGMVRGIPSWKRRDCWSGRKRPISKSMPRSYFLAIDSASETRCGVKINIRMLRVLRYRISVSFSDVSGSGNSCSGILPTEEPEKMPLNLLHSDYVYVGQRMKISRVPLEILMSLRESEIGRKHRSMCWLKTPGKRSRLRARAAFTN